MERPPDQAVPDLRVRASSVSGRGSATSAVFIRPASAASVTVEAPRRVTSREARAAG